MIVWLTGNSGSGKTTLAKRLCQGTKWINLDGDEMRQSISLGAGFSKQDREEHNLRVARLALALYSQGFNIVVSVIAPFESTRLKIDKIIDCKWIYIKKAGLLKPDRPYEEPVGVPIINTDLNNIDKNYKLLRRAIYE